jgi:hypothetical protein
MIFLDDTGIFFRQISHRKYITGFDESCGRTDINISLMRNYQLRTPERIENLSRNEDNNFFPLSSSYYFPSLDFTSGPPPFLISELFWNYGYYEELIGLVRWVISSVARPLCTQDK